MLGLLGSIVSTLGFGDFTMLDTTNPSLDFTDLQYCVHEPILGLLGSNVGIDTFTLGFGDFTMLDTANPSLDFTIYNTVCMIQSWVC